MDDILLPEPAQPAGLLLAEPKFAEPTAPAPQYELQPEPLLAPWWHTLAILLIITGWASLSGRRIHTYTYTPGTRIASYLSMIMMSWMLFGSTVSGIRDRGAFFFSTLRHRANSFRQDFRRGLAVYAGIYLLFVFGAFTYFFTSEIYKTFHPATAAATQQAAPNTASRLPPPPPTTPVPVRPSLASRMHFNSKVIEALGPKTAFELLLWLAVSFTAGFCEEHIFRGYMLQQTIAVLRRARISSTFAAILSIAITSLIFGSLHLYEGLGGAALITLLGILYSITALKLGNLRAVIGAHFLQDFVAGCMLFVLHLRHTV